MIERRKKFFSFLQDALGAIDGTCIRAHTPSDKAVSYNRKGSLTQNVLAVCCFNMQFYSEQSQALKKQTTLYF